MKTELVILDLDGTVIDSFPGIVASFQHSLKTVGIEGISDKQIHDLIGLPLQKMFPKLVSPEKKHLVGKFVAEYLKHYPANALKNTKLFPQVKETLEALKARGKKLAVATTKEHSNSEPILEGLGIMRLFDFVLGFDDVERPKPDPEMILLALQKSGVKAENAVMVGDSVFDIEAAKSAEVKAIGVSFGIGTEEELENAGAKPVINDFSELLEIVE